MTVEVAHLLVTVILIAVYLFVSRAQSAKIESQSQIIESLQKHLQFFDVAKIKEYVEMRDQEKDKVIAAIKSSAEHQLAVSQKMLVAPTPEQKKLTPEEEKRTIELQELGANFIANTFAYLASKPDNDAQTILESLTRRDKELLIDIMTRSQRIIGDKGNQATKDEAERIFGRFRRLLGAI